MESNESTVETRIFRLTGNVISVLMVERKNGKTYCRACNRPLVRC